MEADGQYIPTGHAKEAEREAAGQYCDAVQLTGMLIPALAQKAPIKQASGLDIADDGQ